MLAREELERLKQQRAVELEAQAESALSANWQAYYERLNEPARAWADLLLRENWHWFCTLTFRVDHQRPSGGLHEEKCIKAFRLFVSKLNRELYGPNWHKRPHAQGGVVWALGQELHRSGRLHFHALVAAPQVDLNSVARRLSWMDVWFEHFGIARIEPPDRQADVCGYVCKYVVKDGEVTLSDNFGSVRPPSLWDAPAMAVADIKQQAPKGSC